METLSKDLADITLISTFELDNKTYKLVRLDWEGSDLHCWEIVDPKGWRLYWQNTPSETPTELMKVILSLVKENG